MSNTNFGVAILGFGTVGSGVYSVLQEGAAEIERKYGLRFEVRKILVRRPTAPRAVPIPKQLIAKDIHEIVSDPSIDVVIECVGGETDAKDYILEAFRNGKHVITANKKLCGHIGDKLVEKARQYDRFFGFAGAVTGFHQYCSSITGSVMIRSLIGVFNGTSNYILTRMEEGLSRDDALHEAQAKGYAEADPSDDIDGIDTRNKLIIVTKLGFGVFLRQDQVPIEGMREVALEDVEFAKKNGYSIKLLGVSRLDSDGMMCAYVAPCLVPMSDPLASVRGVFNGIQVYDLLRGLQGMMASGAGSKPTAMAIFTDLINMAREQDILWPASSTADRTLRIAKSRPAANYYVRMNVQNRAGSLAKITKAFGKAGINIGSIEQPPAAGASELPVMVICGPAEEREVRQLIGELGGISEVMGKPVMLRIEASAETSAAEPDGSKKEATTCA